MEGSIFPRKRYRSLSAHSPGRTLCEDKLIYWGQYNEPVCWFLSILISTFYSQRIRRKLFKAAKSWNLTYQLFILLDHVLRHKYVHSDDKFADAQFFQWFSALRILNLIQEYDPTYFFKIEEMLNGYHSLYYIKYFYDILHMDSLMIDVYDRKSRNPSVMYSVYNHVIGINTGASVASVASASVANTSPSSAAKKHIPVKVGIADEQKVLSALSSTPDILIVVIHPTSAAGMPQLRSLETKNGKFINYYTIHNIINKTNILSFDDEISYNGKQYVLDAVILDNWNTYIKNGHIICGITCKGNRYIYNGWTKQVLEDPMDITKQRKIPCKLVEHDWNIHQDDKFCLSSLGCGFESQDDLRACFSFSKGRRILIYVRGTLPGQINSLPEYQTFDIDKNNSSGSQSVEHHNKKARQQGGRK